MFTELQPQLNSPVLSFYCISTQRLLPLLLPFSTLQSFLCFSPPLVLKVANRANVFGPGMEEDKDSEWTERSYEWKNDPLTQRWKQSNMDKSDLTNTEFQRSVQRDGWGEGIKAKSTGVRGNTSMMALVSKSAARASDRINSTSKSWRDSDWTACWWNLPDVAAPAALRRPGVNRGFCLAGRLPTTATQLSPWRCGMRGPTETETTQAFQSGTNRVCRAAEQSSSHSPHPHVSGSLAFTGFVGRKIWVYVCTYNIWQQGDIQIQLRRMLFAWVTVLAVNLFQRLLSEELFSWQMHKLPGFSIQCLLHSNLSCEKMTFCIVLCKAGFCAAVWLRAYVPLIICPAS